ncbi:hypothetical protein BDZ97DRAFT_1922495 [Flammula alnicola]|nr:hypothetical protein BDZ97DRAFT_1922495 [Flammula alnicola]
MPQLHRRCHGAAGASTMNLSSPGYATFDAPLASPRQPPTFDTIVFDVNELFARPHSPTPTRTPHAHTNDSTSGPSLTLMHMVSQNTTTPTRPAPSLQSTHPTYPCLSTHIPVCPSQRGCLQETHEVGRGVCRVCDTFCESSFTTPPPHHSPPFHLQAERGDDDGVVSSYIRVRPSRRPPSTMGAQSPSAAHQLPSSDSNPTAATACPSSHHAAAAATMMLRWRVHQRRCNGRCIDDYPTTLRVQRQRRHRCSSISRYDEEGQQQQPLPPPPPFRYNDDGHHLPVNALEAGATKRGESRTTPPPPTAATTKLPWWVHRRRGYNDDAGTMMTPPQQRVHRDDPMMPPVLR